MATITADRAAQDRASPSARLDNPAFQAFTLLRIGFTVAPILFGLDKFLDWLVDWRIYLAPEINDLVPGNAHQAMLAVGVIEIVAGARRRRPPEVRWLPRRRLAGRDHHQPAPAGRLLRHRPARLRAPARRADPGPPGHRVRPPRRPGVSRADDGHRLRVVGRREPRSGPGGHAPGPRRPRGRTRPADRHLGRRAQRRLRRRPRHRALEALDELAAIWAGLRRQRRVPAAARPPRRRRPRAGTVAVPERRRFGGSSATTSPSTGSRTPTIPVHVVATDVRSGEEVVLSTGDRRRRHPRQRRHPRGVPVGAHRRPRPRRRRHRRQRRGLPGRRARRRRRLRAAHRLRLRARRRRRRARCRAPCMRSPCSSSSA